MFNRAQSFVLKKGRETGRCIDRIPIQRRREPEVHAPSFCVFSGCVKEANLQTGLCPNNQERRLFQDLN